MLNWVFFLKLFTIFSVWMRRSVKQFESMCEIPIIHILFSNYPKVHVCALAQRIHSVTDGVASDSPTVQSSFAESSEFRLSRCRPVKHLVILLATTTEYFCLRLRFCCFQYFIFRNVYFVDWNMDLSRATNERKLYLCKWYFRGKLHGDFYIGMMIHRYIDHIHLYLQCVNFSWFCSVAACVGHQYILVFQWSVPEASLYRTEINQNL